MRGEVQLPTISSRAFSRTAAVTVAAYALLVVTGGAVRLTGSGLGCPDWPSCYRDGFTAAASFHPLIEFSNRLVTVGVSVISIVCFLAALLHAERRRDLNWLSGGLILGLVAQIVLGGLVVLFHLNPYLVAVHFLLTLVVLGDALVLWHRSRTEAGRAPPVVGRDMIWLSRLLVGALTLVVSLGTIVSGAGPHAGAPGTRRIAIAFRDIAELHSSVALFLIGLTLATLFALHQAQAPDHVQRRARLLFEVLAIQGALGYTQYALHDAAAVVEIHLVGATSAWCAGLSYYLSLRPGTPLVVHSPARSFPRWRLGLRRASVSAP